MHPRTNATMFPKEQLPGSADTISPDSAWASAPVITGGASGATNHITVKNIDEHDESNTTLRPFSVKLRNNPAGGGVSILTLVGDSTLSQSGTTFMVEGGSRVEFNTGTTNLTATSPPMPVVFQGYNMSGGRICVDGGATLNVNGVVQSNIIISVGQTPTLANSAATMTIAAGGSLSMLSSPGVQLEVHDVLSLLELKADSAGTGEGAWLLSAGTGDSDTLLVEDGKLQVDGFLLQDATNAVKLDLLVDLSGGTMEVQKNAFLLMAPTWAAGNPNVIKLEDHGTLRGYLKLDSHSTTAMGVSTATIRNDGGIVSFLSDPALNITTTTISPAAGGTLTLLLLNEADVHVGTVAGSYVHADITGDGVGTGNLVFDTSADASLYFLEDQADDTQGSKLNVSNVTNNTSTSGNNPVMDVTFDNNGGAGTWNLIVATGTASWGTNPPRLVPHNRAGAVGHYGNTGYWVT
jgi:hypothetical protein